MQGPREEQSPARSEAELSTVPVPLLPRQGPGRASPFPARDFSWEFPLSLPTSPHSFIHLANKLSSCHHVPGTLLGNGDVLLTEVALASGRLQSRGDRAQLVKKQTSAITL